MANSSVRANHLLKLLVKDAFHPLRPERVPSLGPNATLEKEYPAERSNLGRVCAVAIVLAKIVANNSVRRTFTAKV